MDNNSENLASDSDLELEGWGDDVIAHETTNHPLPFEELRVTDGEPSSDVLHANEKQEGGYEIMEHPLETKDEFLSEESFQSAGADGSAIESSSVPVASTISHHFNPSTSNHDHTLLPSILQLHSQQAQQLASPQHSPQAQQESQSWRQNSVVLIPEQIAMGALQGDQLPSYRPPSPLLAPLTTSLAENVEAPAQKPHSCRLPWWFWVGAGVLFASSLIAILVGVNMRPNNDQCSLQQLAAREAFQYSISSDGTYSILLNTSVNQTRVISNIGNTSTVLATMVFYSSDGKNNSYETPTLTTSSSSVSFTAHHQKELCTTTNVFVKMPSLQSPDSCCFWNTTRRLVLNILNDLGGIDLVLSSSIPVQHASIQTLSGIATVQNVTGVGVSVTSDRGDISVINVDLYHLIVTSTSGDVSLTSAAFWIGSIVTHATLVGSMILQPCPSPSNGSEPPKLTVTTSNSINLDITLTASNSSLSLEADNGDVTLTLHSFIGAFNITAIKGVLSVTGAYSITTYINGVQQSKSPSACVNQSSCFGIVGPGHSTNPSAFIYDDMTLQIFAKTGNVLITFVY